MLPLSTYAKTKVDSEKRLHELSDENFQVISMRSKLLSVGVHPLEQIWWQTIFVPLLFLLEPNCPI